MIVTPPHHFSDEVVNLKVDNGWSGIRAWGEYLGLTQAEVAQRLNIERPTYAQMEAPDAKPRKATKI
ncbi:helix-turn-helix domain-containing protein [Oligella urethralis]|uniref:helix-turn-helix domain-containing protein n=1 Tax=Oligella urethralis TaxID=90245 RepID=UPI0015F0017D|nr:helix-turn-helix transcriptional regulator [Oligella urethralis]